MRELVIGDIHGCARSFGKLLEVIAPQPADTVILLGDYIDRGPASREVIEMILDLNRKCTAIPLAGNHEKMLLRACSEPESFDEWLRQGGDATLGSYARWAGAEDLSAIPRHHWDFLRNQLLDYWESEKQIFVHATVAPDLDLDEQPDFLLFWQRFASPTVHRSGKQLICGHASQKSGWPALFHHGICIDTWACGGGWLTCLDTSAEMFMQANENGEYRSFTIQTLTDEDSPQQSER